MQSNLRDLLVVNLIFNEIGTLLTPEINVLITISFIELFKARKEKSQKFGVEKFVHQPMPNHILAFLSNNKILTVSYMVFFNKNKRAVKRDEDVL